MSKNIDLNKLSLDQLAEYVKQQQKIQQSKPALQPVIKQPKTVKSITIKPSTKLSQILSSSGKVLNYPKKLYQ